MVAYLINPESEDRPLMRNAMLPGVSLGNLYRIYNLPSPRILKTHSVYRRGIKKAIYLVRDGRDVLVSYYHYNITRKAHLGSLSFEEFFDQYCLFRYGHLWHQNVFSWIQQGSEILGPNLKIIKFEDLVANTIKELAEIIEFLNIQASDQDLEDAVDSASIERMRKLEKEKFGEVENKNKRFYRRGEVGEWEEYFTPSLVERFNQMAGGALQLAGYAVD
jgi:hypothetical protein